MAKKTLELDGLLKSDAPEGAAPEPQRQVVPPKKRAAERRVTVALDGATYRRLRLHAANTDATHQTILARALTEFLKRANA